MTRRLHPPPPPFLRTLFRRPPLSLLLLSLACRILKHRPRLQLLAGTLLLRRGWLQERRWNGMQLLRRGEVLLERRGLLLLRPLPAGKLLSLRGSRPQAFGSTWLKVLWSC